MMIVFSHSMLDHDTWNILKRGRWRDTVVCGSRHDTRKFGRADATAQVLTLAILGEALREVGP